ncbi:hypothetical protein Rumeso_01035 [Rubellimicrobium mesophilum DSM 19309]|uniref:Uncharacterized protein n=1 Tax=Rubellimicrobium mesophilum DSM 19309 TaxID=442562 RepID=A0A017HT35_9RHOB|nr:hypothetical protein [Rubellimicrobium mesophilum]EYD77328.1 hypothetical protein Rumeso_01035 [Rubellimicrobium mesophilum DSM 19309]
MVGERPIFAEDESGRLVPMTPAAPPSEDELQDLIAEHPDIVGEEQGELLFLAREQPVTDSEGGAGRWSLDHLFVTRGAVPVLLEVKRATDTRLRREVVGQLLDYAANGTAYWPTGTLEGAFRATCAERDEDPDERLAEFLGESEASDFWSQVETNLAAGRVRLVIAADLIPPELARIIEFLSDQMRAEVRGVELRYYRSAAGRRTLVPRIVGLTERARAMRGEDPQGPRATSLGEWLDLMRSERGEAVTGPAERLVALLKELGAEFGTRKDSITVGFVVPGREMVKPLRLTWRGRVRLVPASLSSLPAFGTSDSRREWLEKIKAQVGELSRTDREPYLRIDRLTGERWLAFESILRELVGRIKSR